MANDTQSMYTSKGSSSVKHPDDARSDNGERRCSTETPWMKQSRSCSSVTPISKRIDKDSLQSARCAPARMSLSPERCKNQWRPRPTNSSSLDRGGREHVAVHAGRSSRRRHDWGVTAIAPMKKKWLDARRFRDLLQFKSKKTGKSANIKEKFKVGDMAIMVCIAGIDNVNKEPMISVSSKSRTLNGDVVSGSRASEVLKRKRDEPDLHSHSPAMAVKEICRMGASFEGQTSLSHSGTKSRQLARSAAFKQHR
ncbi:hypothetical protein ACLOJK_009599 [Asimina triloba]